MWLPPLILTLNVILKHLPKAVDLKQQSRSNQYWSIQICNCVLEDMCDSLWYDSDYFNNNNKDAYFIPQ